MIPYTTYIQHGPTPTPVPQTVQPVPETTTPTDTGDTGSTDQGSGSTDRSPHSAGDSMLTDINYRRKAYGKTALTWSNELADAALNTGTLDGGISANEVHHNAQMAAEVIAPGSDISMGKDLQGHSPFEISYISWLCEVPDGRLGDLCKFQQDIMWTVYNGQTGDNAVLTDDKYTTIGCAFAKNPNADSSWSSQGLWVCDLR